MELAEFAAVALAEELARPEPPPELGPGIYPDLPMSTYLALPYVSAGALHAISRSPAHGRAYVEQPPKVGAEDSIATIIGTALHCALIEPDTFAQLYVRGPGGNWSHKVPKDAVAALRSEYPGALVLKPHKYDAILAARRALLDNPAVSAILRETTAREVSIVWDDPQTHLRCKARPDLVLRDWDTVVDLKTTIDASPGPNGFAREIAKYGYDCKAAWYLEGVNELRWGLLSPQYEREYDSFVFIAAEVYEPYASATYQLTDESIDCARAQNRRLLRLWAECQANDDWPSYPTDITYIATPEWRQAQLLGVV